MARKRYKPEENGYIKSFNAPLRDELPNREIFYTLKEAQVLIESWRRHYNAVRTHSSLRYRPPVPETKLLTHIINGTPGESDLNGHQRVVTLVRHGLQIA